MLDLIRRGTVAGFVAGITVALVVFVHDLILMEPFATPRLLAQNLIGAPAGTEAGGSPGLSVAGGALPWVAAFLVGVRDIAFFTIAHFAVFAVLGILGAWLFSPGRWSANVATGALYGAVAGSAVLLAGLLFFAPNFVAAPSWPLLLAANAVAGVVLVAQLTDPPEPFED
ncbi:MAG: hypothetical protein R3266_12305 [Gemmatimonadota bacterium]|nr:hypothetical protein [Gemmatimonadota bacterium]